ncbi:TonB family protein [Cyclobacterium marinum]|uniref:TonB family protein n=1 Tax=Cyclobacterium marinum TaxID=104 RepID=UPI0011EC7AB2|nr:TonB family protein [Cyclobacterium marinum]MBI0398310.1 TonB family protein [Cyclobacterium marinum]
MKITHFFIVLVLGLIIISCSSNPQNSEHTEPNKDEEVDAIADTNIDTASTKDMLDTNVLIDKEASKDTLDVEPSISAIILVDEDPKPLNLGEIYQAIGYPSKAKEAGIEGSVVVSVLVGENGEYLKHKIITHAHPLLSDPVDLEVKNLRFTPAMKAGETVKVWINLPFKFKLVN